jgi:hypothetical protein
MGGELMSATPEQMLEWNPVECVYCGAKPGEFCRTAGGAIVMGGDHQPRQAAEDAYRRGLDEGRVEGRRDAITSMKAVLDRMQP